MITIQEIIEVMDITEKGGLLKLNEEQSEFVDELLIN
jgi:hypothetical protein